MISFVCPGCSARYSVKEEFAGKKTRCKKCNAVVSIPLAEPSDLDPPELGFLDDAEPRGSSVAVSGSSARSPTTPERTSSSSSIYSAPELTHAAPERMPLRRDDAPSAVGPPPVHYTSVANARGGSVAAAYAATNRSGRGKTTGFDDPSLNSLTVMLLALFILGTIIMACLVHYEASKTENVSWIVIPVIVLGVFIYYFGVITPGTMGGVWLTLKMFGQPAPAKLYLRSAGVYLAMSLLGTAVNIPAFLFISALGALGVPGPVLLVLLLLLIVFEVWITFWSFNRYFYTTALQSFIAMCISGFISLLLLIPAGLIFFAVMAAFTVGDKVANDLADSGNSRARSSRSSYTSSSSVAPAASSRTPEELAAERLNAERERKRLRMGFLDARLKSASSYLPFARTREEMEDRMDDVRQAIAAEEATLAGEAEFAQLKQDLAALETKIATLPTRRPAPELFQPLLATETWDAAPDSVAAFAEPVQVLDKWCLRLPAGAKLNLANYRAGSVAWTDADKTATLRLSISNALIPKQQRPWMVSADMERSLLEEPHYWIVCDPSLATTGKIGSHAFTRTRRLPSDNNKALVTTYIARLDGAWLVAEVQAVGGETAGYEVLDLAVRTLRPVTADEKLAEAMSAERLVAAMPEYPQMAQSLLAKMGPRAEPAVLAVAEDAAHPHRGSAIALLEKVGTEKSVASLWRLAYDADRTIAKAARAVLVKLDPKKADPVTFALEDLKLPPTRENSAQRGEALTQLAVNAPDGRVEMVAEILEKILLDEAQSDLAAPAGRALAVWNRPKTVDTLLPILSNPKSENHPNLDAMIRAAGGLSDKRIATQVCKWLTLRKDAVSDACASLGAPAEDELIKLLNAAPGARTEVCQVLARMGTNRCVTALEKLKRDRSTRMSLGWEIDKTLAAVRERESAK